MFGAKTCVHCRAICTLLLNGESIDNDILLIIGCGGIQHDFTVNKNNSTVLTFFFKQKVPIFFQIKSGYNESPI